MTQRGPVFGTVIGGFFDLFDAVIAMTSSTVIIAR